MQHKQKNDPDRQSSPVAPATSIRELPAWRSAASHLRLWLALIIGLTADLWTKQWAVQSLTGPDGASRPLEIIDGYFRFALVENPGAVFGVAAGQTHILLAISVVALTLILVFFWNSKASHRLSHIALGMLLAGALGNMRDRLFNHGLVIDFIEVDLGFWPFHPWPNFNAADSLLCVGVGLLMIHLFQLENKSQPDKAINHAG